MQDPSVPFIFELQEEAGISPGNSESVSMFAIHSQGPSGGTAVDTCWVPGDQQPSWARHNQGAQNYNAGRRTDWSVRSYSCMGEYASWPGLDTTAIDGAAASPYSTLMLSDSSRSCGLASLQQGYIGDRDLSRSTHITREVCIDAAGAFADAGITNASEAAVSATTYAARAALFVHAAGLKSSVDDDFYYIDGPHGIEDDYADKVYDDDYNRDQNSKANSEDDNAGNSEDDDQVGVWDNDETRCRPSLPTRPFSTQVGKWVVPLDGVQHQHQKSATYVCKVSDCRKTLARPEHLRRHEMIHTGRRPFVCRVPECKRDFGREDNLRDHYFTHIKHGSRRGRNTKMTLQELEGHLGNSQKTTELVKRLRKRCRSYQSTRRK